MTQSWPILSMTTFFPLLGALGILMIRGTVEEVDRNARWTALWVSLITFVLSIFLWLDFDSGSAGFQFTERYDWIPTFNITYHMGIDGISLFLVLLSTFLTPICVLASWEAIKNRVKEYMVAFLILETMMVGMFCALDFVLFYIFFEGVLIPMFLIIGVWGGSRRVYAAFKFFLYTLLGSVLMLLAILTMYFQANTTDIPTLMGFRFSANLQNWLWLACFASFAVKVPMWPVHTWLPDAHVEAPTAGSVILAGVLLKMGAYGFLRFSIPIMPIASEYFTPLIFILSIIAVIYTSLVALVQDDMKKLIAYSSVAHMGFVTVGIFTINQQAVQGAIIQMISHGIVSAALFLSVGVLYDRVKSREISNYGGLVHRMPKFSLCFMLFMLASVGLPGTSGFIGELLILVGAFQVNTVVATLTATGIILSAAYMLYLYRRVIFGRPSNENLKSIFDLSRREISILTPLVIIIFWIGVFPNTYLEPIEASVVRLVENYHFALVAADEPGKLFFTSLSSGVIK